MIRQVADESAKAGLNQELSDSGPARSRREFHVVVFGTGSAGKTSLINALLGREAGKTEPIMGTTQRAENHTYTMEGVEGTVFLTDTPGLSEIGEAGSAREREARELAARADLLVFVLDHDLIRTEYEPLAALVRQGKRSIVVLNKTDRFTEADSAAILAKLRERLRGLVPADDVVAGAAAPRPMPVRVQRADGSIETVLEAQPPELARPARRIAQILQREGDTLRAGNLLLRAHLLSRKAQDQLAMERDRAGQGRDREVSVDHGRHRLRQSVPGPRAGRQRSRPVPDDLGAGRRLRRPDLDVARPDDRRPDDPDALEARPGRDGHVADRRHLQVDAGRLRGRGRRAGRLDGLPDPHLGRSVRRILPRAARPGATAACRPP